MDYAQVEEQFKDLKQQFAAGKLDETAFKAKLNELMVQDESGRWWMIGYETGQWYTHDGKAWVRADPPGQGSKPPAMAKMETTPPPVSPGVNAIPGTLPPAGTANKMGWGFWLGWVGSLVAGIVILLWISYRYSDSILQAIGLGASVGILQWVIMRQYVQKAWLWFVANVAFMLFVGVVGNALGGSSIVIVLMSLYILADLIVGPLLIARAPRTGAGG